MNVIWVISDTLRRDHVGVYGNKENITPAIDALAAKSIRFDRHYIAGFPTMPARADFLTGRWTMSYMLWEPLFPEEVVLPEVLAKKGIHTAAVVDTPFYIRDGMNFDKGFMHFTEIPGQVNIQFITDPDTKNIRVMHGLSGGDEKKDWRYESDYIAPKTFTKAGEWLERHYKENFFLYIDAWDPHEPWEAPEYYRERFYPGHDGKEAPPVYGYWPQISGITEEMVKKTRASYCGEIAMVDTWFGYFMKKVENLGLLKNTVIIFTSDHGYYFGEHGGIIGKMVFARDKNGKLAGAGIWSHSPYYEEITNVPLLIYMPGAKPGAYKGITSAVDLMPTVCELTGTEIPSRVQGKSLLPAIKNLKTPGRPYTVSGHPFINIGDKVDSVDDNTRLTEKDSTATVTTEDWTLLFNTEPGLSELFNIKDDPKQEKNLIKENPAKAKELHQLLVKYMKETNLAERLLKPRMELRL
jgi:arylsulfatase A-like enzyme